MSLAAKLQDIAKTALDDWVNGERDTPACFTPTCAVPPVCAEPTTVCAPWCGPRQEPAKEKKWYDRYKAESAGS